MKKTYHAPKAVRIKMSYETAYGKKCHFADYQECSVSAQQFK